jgi:hypothetical protein
MNAPPVISHENSESFSQKYANSVQIKLCLWDMELIFGTLQPPKVPESTATILNWGSVILSPPQAKALAQLLAQHVEMYEQNFGPISLKAWVPPTVGGRKM